MPELLDIVAVIKSRGMFLPDLSAPLHLSEYLNQELRCLACARVTQTFGNIRETDRLARKPEIAREYSCLLLMCERWREPESQKVNVLSLMEFSEVRCSGSHCSTVITGVVVKQRVS
jgi:hypothetical protein